MSDRKPVWKLFAKPRKGGGTAKVFAVVWPAWEDSQFPENLGVQFLSKDSPKFNAQYELDALQVLECADEYFIDMRPANQAKAEPAKPYRRKARPAEPEDVDDVDEADEPTDW